MRGSILGKLLTKTQIPNFRKTVAAIVGINELHLTHLRSSRSRMLFKIGVLKNFEIYTGKYPSQGFFLIKLQASNLIK